MLWRPDSALNEQIHVGKLGWRITVDETALSVNFGSIRKCLSSSIYRGGFVAAEHFINMRVSPECPLATHDPADLVSEALAARNIDGPSLGMMTAASMQSSRLKVINVREQSIVVLLTSGIANARRAGDLAEHRHVFEKVEEVGTINILVGASIALSPAALVEAVMIVTEAKSAVLQELGVLSPISKKVATGTGTDSIAIVCPETHSDKEVKYVGKHTIFGESLARAVSEALTSSLQYSPTSLLVG